MDKMESSVPKNQGETSKRIVDLKSKVGQAFSQTMFTMRRETYERVLGQTQGEHQAVRIAKCLATFLREKEIILAENDLLAGHAQFVDCKYSAPTSIEDEFQTYNTDPDAVAPRGDEALLLEQLSKGLRIGMFQRGGSGHVIAGYDTLLVKGFGFYINQAKAKLEKAEKGNNFALASLVILEAASDYARRYAEKARQLATGAADEEHRQQMLRIATACDWVAVNPPRDFFEAVQLLWLAHEIVIYEQYCGSMSLGRLDQYLYPYYTKGIAAGTLTYEAAAEIIEALWIKFAGLRKGYQNVTLGGIGPDGNYAANDLSYICLRATKKLRMDQPLLSVRWHQSIPAEFWAEIQELIEIGIGFPALFNDEIAIAAKERLGITPQDAANYGVIGCVEIAVPGKEYSHTEGFRINWAKVMELVLNGGICTFSGENMPLKTKRDLTSIKTFNDFYQWYKEELSYFLDQGIRALNILDGRFESYWPTPFLSSIMLGCLEKGHDVTGGGTIYNLTSVNGCGMANVADSLAAIKKVVFDEQKLSLSELAAALRNDFAGAEALQKELTLKCPKFGNDNDAADKILADLTADFCQQIDGYRNPRGGRFQTGLYTVEMHAILGKKTGALPDGRRKGVALANALSPVQGADTIGPTAVIRSMTKLNLKMLGNGMVLDLKFHPSFFNSDKHRQAFRWLIETYFQLGGMEVQFNVIDRATLLQAQQTPEAYRDLIVRVSGFSAYFITLDKTLQDEIITRTEYAAI